MVTRKPRIAGIVLAAGMGRRMGSTKQLLPIGGIPILQHIINIALASKLDTVVVVLGHDIPKIREAVDLSGVTVVENQHYEKGQSTSLKAGIQALSPDIDASLFLLADQPLVDAGIINCLIEAYHSHKDPILRPIYKEKHGNPVLMDKSVFPFLLKQTGDIGGRGVFGAFKEKIRTVPVLHSGIHTDLDTQTDYQSFLGQSQAEVSGQKLLDVFTPDKNSVISFVGAGGKTTMMFALARELKERGFHVLVTTTTAIYHPDRDGWVYDQLWLNAETVELTGPDLKGGGLTIAAASYDKKSGKIKGYEPKIIDNLQQQCRFDYILVEADGSKGRPLKAPADHEPVVPALTQYIFGLIGLSSLGKPLSEEWVHRSRQFSELTDCKLGKPITEAEIQSLIGSPQGLFKNSPCDADKIVVLNGAYTTTILEQGYTISKSLRMPGNDKSRPSRTLICNMLSYLPVQAVFDST